MDGYLGADQLRSFLAVIVFGSFTKAAERVRRHSSNLEIAREPLYLPVAIAHGIKAVAAIEFAGGRRLGLGASRLRFLERPLRRWR
jgi:hypothetical protein